MRAPCKHAPTLRRISTMSGSYNFSHFEPMILGAVLFALLCALCASWMFADVLPYFLLVGLYWSRWTPCPFPLSFGHGWLPDCFLGPLAPSVLWSFGSLGFICCFGCLFSQLPCLSFWDGFGLTWIGGPSPPVVFLLGFGGLFPLIFLFPLKKIWVTIINKIIPLVNNVVGVWSKNVVHPIWNLVGVICFEIFKSLNLGFYTIRPSQNISCAIAKEIMKPPL